MGSFVWIPIVYFLQPETKDHSFESIEALFSSSSPFNSAMERSYQERGDVIAMRGGLEEEERRMSVISVASEKTQKLELEV